MRNVNRRKWRCDEKGKCKGGRDKGRSEIWIDNKVGRIDIEDEEKE